MAPSPLKMADCENKIAAAPWFPWDSATGLSVALKAGAGPGYYEARIHNIC